MGGVRRAAVVDEGKCVRVEEEGSHDPGVELRIVCRRHFAEINDSRWLYVFSFRENVTQVEKKE